MTRPRNWILAAAMLMYSISTADFAMAQDFQGLVTETTVTDSEVRFSIKSGYERVTLVVAGPGEFILERSFAMGEEPTFSISSVSHALADGSYTFELRGAMSLPDVVSSQLTEARNSGDRMLIAAILSDAGLDPSASVTMGRIGIFDGQFVVPDTEPLPTRAEPRTGNGGSGTSPIDGFRDAVANGSASLSGVVQDGLWLDAMISSTNADGSVANYRGYVLPPQVAQGSDKQYLRAYFRLVDSGEAGPWVRGYFESDEGSFRFVDQSTFDASGLRSAISAPIDYTMRSPEAVSSEPLPPSELRDQKIQDDLVVVGSICAGFDCVSGESFGFDTIRLKENNLRARTTTSQAM